MMIVTRSTLFYDWLFYIQNISRFGSLSKDSFEIYEPSGNVLYLASLLFPHLPSWDLWEAYGLTIFDT